MRQVFLTERRPGWKRPYSRSVPTETVLFRQENIKRCESSWERPGDRIGVVLLLGVVFAFVVYVSRQRRRRMAREVEFSRLRADIGRRLTEQYVKGLENERERMARELHDGICNDLSGLSMNLAKGVSPGDAAQLLDNCRESVRRISHELMPPEFAYANLEEVVRYHLYKQREAYAGKVEIGYTASKGAWENVSDSIALEVYRIVDRKSVV